MTRLSMLLLCALFLFVPLGSCSSDDEGDAPGPNSANKSAAHKEPAPESLVDQLQVAVAPDIEAGLAIGPADGPPEAVADPVPAADGASEQAEPEEEIYDPMPLESPGKPPARQDIGEATVKAPPQVVEFPDGTDPFAALEAPVKPQLDEEDPGADTLRLGLEVPPEPGELKQAFPPDVQELPPPKMTTPELTVVRKSPEGNVDLVDAITASFNQPMVALGSLKELEKAPVPLKLEPEPEGRYIWVGTDTVAFQPKDGRMPFATVFKATVAPGNTSALGKTLEQGLTWTITTPRPKLVSSAPWDGQTELRPETEITLQFNALVDPDKVLEHITFREYPGKALALEVAGPPQRDPEATSADAAAREDKRLSRTVVLRPTEALTPGKEFRLEVDEGVTCEEGPLTAGEKTKINFSTYYPLKVEKIGCHWDDDDCYPGAPINIAFNNRLKTAKSEHLAQRITISPKPEGLRFSVSGNTITAHAVYLPATSYTVNTSVGIGDVHGQTTMKGDSKEVRYRDAAPLLSLPRTGVVVVEGRQSHDIMLSAMNLDTGYLKLAQVPEEKLCSAVNVANDYHSFDSNPTAGLPVNVERELKLTDKANVLKRTQLNLAEALTGSDFYGFVLVDIKARKPRGFFKGWNNYRQVALVQITDLGISAALGEQEMYVLVTTLDRGEPVPGARVKLYHQETGILKGEAVADENGLARLPGPTKIGGSGPYLLLAKNGQDRSFLYLNGSVEVGSYMSSYGYSSAVALKETVAGTLFTERGLYRPAEEVFVSVIARARHRGPDGDLALFKGSSYMGAWEITDPQYNKVASGSVRFSPFGTASFSYKVPKNAPLGTYSVSLHTGRGELVGSFDVQEYRTPEYEAAVQWDTQGANILVRRSLEAVVSADYFFGAPMNGAEVQWNLTRTQSWYSPPGNPGFAFSDIDPSEERRGWGHKRYEDWDDDYGNGGGSSHVAGGAGKLDAAGRMTIPALLDPGKIQGPVSFTLEAEVIDQNRQSVAARASVLAHRAERYVGLAVDRTVVGEGEEVEVSGIVTRLDGSRYDEAKIDVRLIRVDWHHEEVVGQGGEVTYEYKHREIEAGECTITTGQTAGKCLIVVGKPGTYLVRAETRDLAGRPARAALYVYAYGEDMSQWKSDPNNRVELVLDKTDYQPGDTARLLIQSPFAKSRGLLVLGREGFAEVRSIELATGSLAVEIPVKEHWMPGISIQLLLIRGRNQDPGATPDDRGRPAFGKGEAFLSISRDRRKISVQVRPAQEAVEPGGTITVDLRTRDADNKPLSANVALMVVDEGVLSLISYVTPNPLTALYQALSPITGIAELRPLVLARIKPKIQFDQMEESGGLAEEKSELAQPSLAPGGKPEAKRSRKKKGEDSFAQMDDEAPNDGGQPQFTLRQFFKSTAYFDADLKTGKDGKLSVDIKMPDNLTEFRVMAVAADRGVRFGSADSQVRTRRPLVVRPALPRFLNFGDKFEAAVVINNQTGFDTEVLVRCQAANATIKEPATKRVKVRHGKAEEVRFAASAGEPGPASFQFAAVALTDKRDTDAAVVTIPTLIPATSEAFATYGVVEDAARQPIKPPENAIPDFGGLDVALSSSALTGLQDSVKYLFDYPYECTEQLCSRILPILALKDIIYDFKLGDASSPETAKRLVNEGISKLMLRQRSDGGFGFWPGSDESWLYISAYAVMTLDLARKAGYEVPAWPLERAIQFLQQRLDVPHKWEVWAYGSQTMAALVLARLGQAPVKHLARLYKLATDGDKDSNKLTLYARSWLMEALALASKDDSRVGELYRQISNAAIETPSAIHFAEGKSEGLKLMMHSEERTDAVVLYSLVSTRPEDPLIEKVVRGLVRARTRGRWSTTQANAYALLALSRYYEVFEKAVPDFEARLWYGEQTVAAATFKGRDMKIVKTRVPMRTLLEAAAKELILAKEGPGRLYYRLGLKYAPKDLKLDSEDRGFMVERVYMPEGDDGALRRRDDGTWVLKAGAYVKVMLRVVAPDRRYYVAVVDPLPAGLEAVNEAFATSATQRLGEAKTDEWDYDGYHSWYRWNPWDYEERRDDRVQLFMDSMRGGVYEYTYTARATTIGTFVVPPTRAEEMYEPETFGRTASEVFVVEP